MLQKESMTNVLLFKESEKDNAKGEIWEQS